MISWSQVHFSVNSWYLGNVVNQNNLAMPSLPKQLQWRGLNFSNKWLGHGNKAWEIQTSPLKLFWNKWHGKVILVHHISKLSRLIQKYKGLIEEVIMVGQGLVPLVTSAYFSQLSRYGSGFGCYKFSLSSSTTFIYKAKVLVQEGCSKLSKFLKAFSWSRS